MCLISVYLYNIILRCVFKHFSACISLSKLEWAHFSSWLHTTLTMFWRPNVSNTFRTENRVWVSRMLMIGWICCRSHFPASDSMALLAILQFIRPRIILVPLCFYWLMYSFTADFRSSFALHVRNYFVAHLLSLLRHMFQLQHSFFYLSHFSHDSTSFSPQSLCSFFTTCLAIGGSHLKIFFWPIQDGCVHLPMNTQVQWASLNTFVLLLQIPFKKNLKPCFHLKDAFNSIVHLSYLLRYGLLMITIWRKHHYESLRDWDL